MLKIFNRLAAAALLLWCAAAPAQPTLKIGVLGAMSGPAKYWGLTNKYCALTTAKIYNDRGGIKIGDQHYLINIYSYDTELDKKRALIGAKQLINKEGIRYLIGPNIDDTSLAIIPLLEANNVINITYGFSPKLFQPPRENSILGMMHPTVSAPAIYRYLKDNHGVRSVAFLARQDKESINQRNIGIRAAEKTGLDVLDVDAWDITEVTYPANLQGLADLATSYAKLSPDLIVLSGAAPLNTATLIKQLRNKGYKGFISTETAQEPTLLLEKIPDLDKFISLGSSPSRSIHSDYMKTFVREYETIAGQWHDEAGVKVYALEMVLRILQAAGEESLTDTGRFKETAASFSVRDPFYDRKQPLSLIDNNVFGDKRQINVPLTIHVFENGAFRSVSF